jgi:hypothetical protein
MKSNIAQLIVNKRWQVIKYLPDSILRELKTYDSYYRQLWKRVKELYSMKIDRFQFESQLADIVQQQITRAYREALRDEGLDPNLVKTQYADNIQDIIVSEYERISNFAADIEIASHWEKGYEQFNVRTQLWANRYDDAYNRAIADIATEQGAKMEWQLGATEQHCETCAALNGIVARASVWNELGMKPQQPPNTALECGGWQCDCSLVITNKRATPNAKEKIQRVKYG